MSEQHRNRVINLITDKYVKKVFFSMVLIHVSISISKSMSVEFSINSNDISRISCKPGVLTKDPMNNVRAGPDTTTSRRSPLLCCPGRDREYPLIRIQPSEGLQRHKKVIWSYFVLASLLKS